MSEGSPSLCEQHPIVVLCTGCGETVPPGGGWVEVDLVAASEAERKAREWEQTRDEGNRAAGLPAGLSRLDDVLDLPGPVPWRAWHAGCDPDPERETYWIDVERISTWPQVVEWCAHLASKSWIDSTGWWGEMQSLVHGGDGILRAA